MDAVERVKYKIKKVESLIDDIKKEIDNIGKNTPDNSPKKSAEVELDYNILREDYSQLYRDALNGKDYAIDEYIEKHTKSFLFHFCRANDLPLDVKKENKSKLTSEIKRWLLQRKLITERAIA